MPGLSACTYIARCKEESARLMIRGETTADAGYFGEPTTFVDVPATNTISREGILSPVLCVHSFESGQDAVDAANDGDSRLVATAATRGKRGADEVDIGASDQHPSIDLSSYLVEPLQTQQLRARTRTVRPRGIP
jgi:acyl-CoA reductase-like NAD-dependent aldehyde dehydrogenase